MNVILFGFAFVLIIFFVFLKRKDSNLTPFTSFDFGEGSSKKSVGEHLIRQKIKHKEISFFAYLTSLAVSLLLGYFIIIKIINNQLGWNFLVDALGIAAGTIATASFKKLHDKCAKDVEKIGR